MNKFDLVFLLLSSSSAKHFNSFLTLHDSAFTAGFHTSIATCPTNLAHTNKRLRIIIVDACELYADDILIMKECFPHLKETHLIFLADSITTTNILSENNLVTGNSICLPLSINFHSLLNILTALSNSRALSSHTSFLVKTKKNQ